MNQEITDHYNNVAKTVVGGAITYGGTHGVFDILGHFDIVQATQWASLFAAFMTGIYFFVVTVIAVVKALFKSNGS